MKTVTIRSKKEEKREWKKVNGSKKRRWKRQKNVNRSAVYQALTSIKTGWNLWLKNWKFLQNLLG
jgi:hypothetical protein